MSEGLVQVGNFGTLPTFNGSVQVGNLPSNLQTLLGLSPLALYLFNEGSGRDIYNQIQPQSGSDNLALFPEQEFGVFAWPANAAWTNAFAADPFNGFTIASRLNQGAGAGQLLQACSLAAGTYTLSVWAISNTGGTQKFRFNTLDTQGNHFSVDQLVTTSWQQLSATFTAISTITQVGFTSDVANEAMDIIVIGFKVQTGSVATAYAPAVLHLKASYSTPTWSSAGISFSGAQFAEGSLSNNKSTSVVSIYAAVKQSGSPTLAGYRPIINSTVGGAAPNLSLATQYQSVNSGGFFRLGGQGVTAYNSYLDDGNWHIVAAVSDGTKLTYYVDGSIVQQANGVSSATVLTGLMLGNLNAAANWAGSMGVVAVYPAGHSASQVASCTAAVRSVMAGRSVSIPTASRYLAFDGDSITDPATAPSPNYTWITNQNISPIVPASQNFAVSGSTLVNLNARTATVDSRLIPGGKNVLSILIGRNDMAAGIGSVAAFEVAYQAYCQARRAVGWKMVVSTVLPSTLAGFNAARNSFNTWLLANYTTFASALADVGNDPTIGPDAAASNATYYSDGTHPTAAGHAIMAPYFTTAVTSALAS